MKKLHARLSLIAAGMVLSASVLAQAAPVELDIASQPLSQALNTLARQSGAQIVFVTDVTDGKTAPAVKGKLTVREALDKLLKGSGLQVQASDERTFAIVNVTTARAPAQNEQALPEVVVTGEKEARSLAKTASSVRVFDAREIAERDGTMNTQALLANTANITTSGVQNLAPAVRGVDGTGPAQGGDAFLGGTRPRLNMTVDGRTESYNEVIFGDLGLWDVQQVEVFRGSQSLLQGRNSIAGTVVYKTNDPTFTPEYGVRFMAGNRQQRAYSAVASKPLNDEWAFRVALDEQTSNSFVRGFDSYPGVSDPGEFESRMARIKLLYQSKSMPGLKSLFTLTHNEHTGPQTEDLARPFGDKRSSYPAMPVFKPTSTSGVWDLEVPLNDGMKFENRIVYGDVHIQREALPGDGNASIDGHDISIEPRLSMSSADKKITGFVGFYGFSADQKDAIDLFGGGKWDDKTRTSAVYGEATFALQSDLDLTLGGRYEQEHRRRKGTMAFFVTDFDETYKTFLPKISLAWHVRPETTLGAGISRGYNGGGAAFTYDVPYVNYEYKPEYVTNYELFGRSELLGGRLRLNGNLFYSRYKDMQLPFDLNPDPSIWSYVVRNAPRASTYGVEFGLTWLPQAGLTLGAELGLLKTKIDEYPGSGVEGHELPRAPSATLNLDVNWRTPIGVVLGANARYSTAYYSEITNLDRGRVDPGWIANVRASYPLGKVRLFAFVNNVFDSERPILLNSDPNASAAADTASLPTPRTIGVGLESWF
ncbi:MAG TPA: TonB-dependent receptor [Oxalicibacterium sp.]|nr:TonB-dependent receptor [Oxalicibacterium sp.]